MIDYDLSYYKTMTIESLIKVYFERFPEELSEDATYEIEKVISFNSREVWNGDAQVVLSINYEEEDA
jgi:hypothetical protein